MNVRTSRTALALLTAITSLAWGCAPTHDGDNAGDTRATLHRAKGCNDLLGDLQADAAFKVNKAVDQQIAQIKECIAHNGDANCAYGGYVSSGGDSFGEASDTGAEPPRDSQGASPSPTTPGSNSGTSTDSPSSGNSSGAGDQASSHSDTNTQVAGVDEADIVKTDGKNLYILHGNTFKVVKAWPASALAIASSIEIEGQPTEMFVEDGVVVVYSNVNGNAIYTAAGVTPKSGYNDYYGYGGKAEPAITPTNGTTASSGPYVPLSKITILKLTNDTPSVARELYFEGGYLDSRRVGAQVRTVLSGSVHGPKLLNSIYELFGNGDPGTAPGNPGSPDKPPNTTPPSPPVDAGSSEPNPGVDAGPAPELDAGTTADASVDEDGGIAPLAFRNDGVSPQDWAPGTYPKSGTEAIQALEQLRKQNLSAIQASQLSDWLPYTFAKDGGKVTASTVACENFYIPTIGSTESGFTEIASIDLANPAALPRETAILGQAQTVYGSADTLYLATNAWIEPPVMWGSVGVSNSGSGSSGGTVASPPPDAQPVAQDGGASASGGTTAPDPAPIPEGGQVRPLTNPAPIGPVKTWSTSKTHVHKFQFASDPSFPTYVASGTVVGSVKDQFSLDDKDGKLRITTTENRFYTTSDDQYVSPSRSTSTQYPNTVNRLFVLAEKSGELAIVGDVGELAPNERIYSTRFVGNRGYVVTFRQVDPLFVVDLATPEKPTLLGELTIPGFSEYMHPIDDNHLLTIGRAATAEGRQQGLQLQIFDVTNGAAPKVAFQYAYSGDEYGMSTAEYDHKAFTYFADKNLLAFPYFGSSSTGVHSSLELFRIDLAKGFSKLGSIDATALVSSPNGYCGGYYGPSVRRGVFLENFIYSLSYGGIIAKDVNDLASKGTELPLPAPQADPTYGSGPVCDVGGTPSPSPPTPDTPETTASL